MQNRVLEILTNADGYISGQEISEQLGVSRQSIWKAVNSLKEKGYKIDSVTNKGYKLVSSPDYLNEQSIKSRLNTTVIGRRLEVFESIGSTNDYLAIEGHKGCPNGTVAVAREQTKGKGRLGRVWQSQKDECIALSVLLRPNMVPSKVSSVTPLAGLAVCKAVREYTKLDCMIKWPNDIIVDRKKLVGILTEMSAEFDAVEFIITGIGINIGQTAFPEEIAYKATSILLETGRKIDKNDFLACILEHLEEEFIRNDMKLTDAALREYADMCATIGKNVSFSRGTRDFSGIAVGIESDGELKVMLADGSICTVNSGEVTVQGIY